MQLFQSPTLMKPKLITMPDLLASLNGAGKKHPILQKPKYFYIRKAHVPWTNKLECNCATSKNYEAIYVTQVK